jgi:nicotinate dehydrogenase subunit A
VSTTGQGPDDEHEAAARAPASRSGDGGHEPRRMSRTALISAGVAAATAIAGGTAYLVERSRSTGLTINVNGRDHPVSAAPDTPLLYVLRNELGLRGPRFGCGLAECGACTVHLDGVAVRSCVTRVDGVGSRRVTTLEGLGTPSNPHPLQRAFIEQQAAQCGYCINGMLMTAAALLASKPRPTDTEIKDALAGNLCRCGSHYRILRAIKAAIGA